MLRRTNELARSGGTALTFGADGLSGLAGVAVDMSLDPLDDIMFDMSNGATAFSTPPASFPTVEFLGD
jgi:hypothetical protein